MNIRLGSLRSNSLIPLSDAPSQKRASLGQRVFAWLKDPFNRTRKTAKAAMDRQFTSQKEALQKLMVRIEGSSRYQTRADALTTLHGIDPRAYDAMALKPEQKEELKAQVAFYKEKYQTSLSGENIAHINAHARYIEGTLSYLEDLRRQIDESEYMDEYDEAIASLLTLKSEEIVSKELPTAANEYLKDRLSHHQIAVKRDQMHEELLQVGAPFLVPSFQTQNPFDSVKEIARLGPSKATFERIEEERAEIDAGGAGFELKQVIAAFTIQRIKELGLTQESIDLIERYHTDIIKAGMGEDLKKVITPLEKSLAMQIDTRGRKITKMASKIEKAAVYDRAKELLKPVGEAFATAKLLKMHSAELHFIQSRIEILQEGLDVSALEELKKIASEKGIDPVQIKSISRCTDIDELGLKADLIEKQIRDIARDTKAQSALFDAGEASLKELSKAAKSTPRVITTYEIDPDGKKVLDQLKLRLSVMRMVHRYAEKQEEESVQLKQTMGAMKAEELDTGKLGMAGVETIDSAYKEALAKVQERGKLLWDADLLKSEINQLESQIKSMFEALKQEARVITTEVTPQKKSKKRVQIAEPGDYLKGLAKTAKKAIKMLKRVDQKLAKELNKSPLNKLESGLIRTEPQYKLRLKQFEHESSQRVDAHLLGKLRKALY